MRKGQGKGRNGVSKQHENALRFAVVNHLLNEVCLEPSLCERLAAKILWGTRTLW